MCGLKCSLLFILLPWGIYITTPEVSDKASTIKIKTTVTKGGSNASDIRLITKIMTQKA